MNTRIITALILLFPCVSLMLGCPGTSKTTVIPAKTSQKTVTLNDKDNGTTTKLNKGNTLEIKLESQPATGFSWELTKYNDTLIPAKGEPTTEKADGSKPGAPDLQIFRFDAIAVGNCDLEFGYLRPFDKDKAPDKTYKVSIQIVDSN